MAKAKKASLVTLDRRTTKTKERREKPVDRRTKSEPVVAERRVVERREKVSRRRQIDPPPANAIIRWKKSNS